MERRAYQSWDLSTYPLAEDTEPKKKKKTSILSRFREREFDNSLSDLLKEAYEESTAIDLDAYAEEDGDGSYFYEESIEFKEPMRSMMDKLNTMLHEDVSDAFITTETPLSTAHERLEKFGFLVVRDFTTKKALECAEDKHWQSIYNMFSRYLSENEKVEFRRICDEKDRKAFDLFKNTKKRRFACISHGFIHVYPTRPEDHATIELNDELYEIPTYDYNQMIANNVFMTYLPTYRTNIDFLCHPETNGEWLRQFGGKDFMVSVDTVNMGARECTDLHTDTYAPECQRFQAVCEGEPHKYKLCVVPFTFRPEVRELIESIETVYREHCEQEQEKNDRKTRKKRKTKKARQPATPKTGVTCRIRCSPLRDLLLSHAVASPANSLLIWRPGTIHGTANTFRCPKTDQHFALLSHSQTYPCFRMYLGMHKSDRLDPEELAKLAILADTGYVPEPFFGMNRKSRVFPEIMCAKKSQYRIYPEPAQGELEEDKRKITTILKATRDVHDEVFHLDRLSYVIPDPLARSLMTGFPLPTLA